MIRITILLVLLPLFAHSQWKAKVIGVYDGDTFTILVDERDEKVRLRSIDCPELGQAYGRNAKKFTSDKIFNTLVEISDTSRDRYGRLLATVTTNDKEVLNELLLKNGLAWHYKKYDNSKKLSDIEKVAREARIGLWSDSSVAPWIWRKAK